MVKRNQDEAPEQLDAATVQFLDEVAREIMASIERGELPSIDLPVRSLSNVRYDPAAGLQQGQPGRQGTAVRHRRHGPGLPAGIRRYGSGPRTETRTSARG
ncbi:MAG TPA: hypothetical protein VK973_18595, partial [Arenicellales bacterium]|nr:hypothetical protein [Arenicellales bacterium]